MTIARYTVFFAVCVCFFGCDPEDLRKPVNLPPAAKAVKSKLAAKLKNYKGKPLSKLPDDALEDAKPAIKIKSEESNSR